MKRAITILTFLGVVLCTVDSYGTAQQPDILLYKGKMYSLYTNPLEGYFKKYPYKKPKTSVRSTSNWRGYVATFELIDSTLFLRDIQIKERDEKNRLRTKSVMSEVFPGQEIVNVEWFSGLLTLPYGQLLKYVHMGYSSAFEHYLILEIRQGTLTKSKDFEHKDYTHFKDRQFELFRQTAEYREAISVLKKESNSTEEQLQSFMKIHGTEYLTYFIEE